MNNPAFPILAILAGSLALSGAARGADSVVLGHGITNQYYAALPCPADSICLDGQYRWELEAARTIVGPLVKGRVRALISQHTDATRKFVQSVELFVLRPIQDPGLRKASDAQYYLLSLSPRYEKNQYCLSVRPSEVGLAVPESQITKNEGSYCFPGSLLTGVGFHFKDSMRQQASSVPPISPGSPFGFRADSVLPPYCDNMQREHGRPQTRET